MARVLVIAGMVAAAAAQQDARAQPSAQAQGPGLRLSGFGTVGVVQTDTNLAEYTSFFLRRGATKTASFEPDSKLGLQMDVQFDPRLSATFQAQTRATSDGNWKPDLVLGFASARLVGGLSARAGRMAGPFFLVSDYRSVGYSMVWIRPPVEVYGQVPFGSFDGADLLYRGEVGDLGVVAQVFAGRSEAAVREARVRLKDLVGVNTAVQWGAVTLRLGHASVKANVNDVDIDALVAGLRSLQGVPLPQFARIGSAADLIETEGKRLSFSGVGVSYEGNNLTATAELTRRKAQASIPQTTGMYGSVGYRLGNWTPFVVAARLKHQTSPLVSAVPSVESLGPAASLLDPGVIAALPTLDAGVSRLLASVGQKSATLGVRWDAMRNLSVKAQYERIRVESSPTFAGLFTNEQVGFGARPVQAYSLAVDFVF